ncbi:MAG: helix-turn-helix domain-containing protein [Clostridium sp.]|uniref:helix-turn-helix domain-containing protein n=1 Tax=Clostridium sp. TaxID=1506 RepID=UPI0025C09E0C|nr:helix-turn-helix transcriptional regulator [Clostridium sp.]MCE5221037.1 helix-turn-helix domain-containing protein [Clostridium sp.]
MEELRERLRGHKKKYGTSLAFIGRNIGIHRCTLSLFINDKRDLPLPIAKKLDQYLNNFDN